MRSSPSDALWQRPRGWLLIAVGSSLAIQLFLACLVFQLSHGKEFANDTADYVKYLDDPMGLLLHKQNHNNGSCAASPVMPLLLAGPYRVFATVAPRFLAFRFTMIAWLTLGLALGWHSAIEAFGAPRNGREFWAGLALVVLPVTCIASGVMTQDDTIAAGWSGIVLWTWRRGGIGWACLAALAGFWCAKVTFALYLIGFWIVAPRLRIRLMLAGLACGAAFLALVHWRDGELGIANYTVSAVSGGSWYSVIWLLFFPGDVAHDAGFTLAAKHYSRMLTALAFGVWTIAALKRRISTPTAVVGVYSLFFSFFSGMMPEYELWYLAWEMFVLWAAVKRQLWRTVIAGWSLSAFGYAYKFFYSCDGIDFVKGNTSALEHYYTTHFGYGLRWVLVFCALGTALSCLIFAYLLWKHDPTRELAASGADESPAP